MTTSPVVGNEPFGDSRMKETAGDGLLGSFPYSLVRTSKFCPFPLNFKAVGVKNRVTPKMGNPRSVSWW